MSGLKRYFGLGEGIAGAIILLVLIAAALFAPLLFPGDPLRIVATPLLAPFDNASFRLEQIGWAVMCWPSFFMQVAHR